MKRNAIIAIVAGALGILLLWYFVLYSPKSKDVSSTQDQVSEAERQQQSLQATLTRLQGLDKERPQQQANLEALNAAIPATPDLANFIFQANEIAAQSGVDWLSVAPTPPVAGTAGPSVITLSIQVQGGFFQVLDYLNRLEKLPRLVVTDTVNISAGGTSAAGAAGSTTATTLPTSTSSTGAPTLNLTLGARMFTRASAVPSAPGVAGGAARPATPAAPTTPTTVPSTATTARGPGIS